MNQILLVLLIALSVTTSAQNKDYLVSMDGIGAIKIRMSQEELEKLLKQKFILRNALDTADSYQDTATAKYKNTNVQLFFQRQYTGDNVYFMYLIGLKTSSPLCKTEKGVGIGSDKLKIILAYEASTISIGPEYEGEDFSIKSKTKYLMDVRSDDGARKLVFYLRNKKVVAVEVGTVFSDSE